MSQKKWAKLNQLLNRIKEDENALKHLKIMGKILGLLVDIVYYFVFKGDK